jgi:hypothetical protein
LERSDHNWPLPRQALGTMLFGEEVFGRRGTDEGTFVMTRVAP